MIRNSKISDFHNRFTITDSSVFKWQATSIQVYDLGRINKYISTPTPIYQTEYYCFVFLKSGKMIEQLGEDILEITAPAFVIILDEIAQSIKYIDPKSEGYVVVSEQKNLVEIFNPFELCKMYNINNVLEVSLKNANWLTSLILLMKAEVETENLNKNILQSLLKTFIYKILDLSNYEKKFDKTQMIAVQFKVLVLKNYKIHHNISFYARKLKISENYLNKCIKSIFNKTSKELLMEIVIQHSKHLLLDKSKNIAKISYNVNFEDPSYFSRFFKKVTGVTPSKFRREFKNDLSTK